MSSLFRRLRQSLQKMPTLNQSGQGLTEYLILILLISVISIGAVQSLGNTVRRKFQEVGKHINDDVELK